LTKGETTMTRFSIERWTILDPDGTDRSYDIIVDNNATKTLEGPFGEIQERWGFLRCEGKQYVGIFGRETPVMAGRDSEVYYASVHEFDGEWYHQQADRRGLHHYVTASSGRGQLFATLENFCAAHQITAR